MLTVHKLKDSQITISRDQLLALVIMRRNFLAHLIKTHGPAIEAYANAATVEDPAFIEPRDGSAEASLDAKAANHWIGFNHSMRVQLWTRLQHTLSEVSGLRRYLMASPNVDYTIPHEEHNPKRWLLSTMDGANYLQDCVPRDVWR